VDVYSVEGSLLCSVKNSGNSYILTSSDIPRGIYIVKVLSDNIPYTTKIVLY